MKEINGVHRNRILWTLYLYILISLFNISLNYRKILVFSQVI